MSHESPPAAEIARFLSQNPGFLIEHAELFSTVTVPHPRLPHVIPLGERQNMMLRERVRNLETLLAELRQQAGRNERISAQLHAWLAGLLSETDTLALAPRFVRGLTEEFGLTGATLLAWTPAVHVHACPAGGAALVRPALDEQALVPLRQYVTALARPACLATSAADASLMPLLANEASSGAPPAGSLAVVPLHALMTHSDEGHDDSAVTTGLLILTDHSRERYVPDMDTLFLERIAHLASAVLTRLHASAAHP